MCTGRHQSIRNAKVMSGIWNLVSHTNPRCPFGILGIGRVAVLTGVL